MEELDQNERILETLDRLDYRTRTIYERLDIIEKHIKFIEAVMGTNERADRKERARIAN